MNGRIPELSRAVCLAFLLCLGASGGTAGQAHADPQDTAEPGASAAPGPDDGSASLPQEGLFSSLKQAFNKSFDHEVVRGHFDVGTPPNSRRYYCLVDPKTGKKEPNGVLGRQVSAPDGMTGVKEASVSLYRCDDAEKQGLLVTAGYRWSKNSPAATPPSNAIAATGTGAAAAAPATDATRATAAAQETVAVAPGDGHVQDEATIQALVAAETDAWNHGDAKAYAARVAQNVSLTNILGQVYYGREAFEQRHAEILATLYKGSVLKQSIGRVRFIRPGVAVVDVDVELRGFVRLPPGIRAGADQALRTRLQMVLVKEGAGWWIESYHNVAVAAPPS